MAVMTNKHIWMASGVAVAAGVALWFMQGDSQSPKTKPAEVEAPADVDEDEALAEAGGMGRAGVKDSEVKPWYPNAAKYEPSVDDVQRWDWLKQDLDLLVDEARPKSLRRVSPDEFKDRYIEASLEYLELDDKETAAFRQAVEDGLEGIDEARSEMEQVKESADYDDNDASSIAVWRDAQRTFQDQQQEVAEKFVGTLPERSRTTLMRENGKRWLVQLDFGIRHAQRRGPKRN